MTNEQLESIRCYESVERMEWVSRRPCVVPGCSAPRSENVHIRREPDGRLTGSAFIVPLCARHRDLLVQQIGTRTFETVYRLDLGVEALDVELRWRQHLAARAESGHGI
jgi:hypothetical protein